MTGEQVAVAGGKSPVRCPFCHDAIDLSHARDASPSSAGWIACATCLARHHGACWKEAGSKCASCGQLTPLAPLAANATPAETIVTAARPNISPRAQALLAYQTEKARPIIIGSTIALALASVLFRALEMGGLKESSALFIGIPALVSVVLALTPNAKSATGMIMKAITFLVLFSGIVLGEGLVCVLMAAPVFYIVGLIAGILVDLVPKRTGPVALIVLAIPLSLEGTSEELSFPRSEAVTREAIVPGTPAEVEARLARTPRFENKPLPGFLRLGFPTPVDATGQGLERGDERLIRFRMGDRTCSIKLRVQEHVPGRVTFRPEHDGTPIAGWLTLQEAEVAWEAAPGGTRVRWTFAYKRRLDPAWYFGPLERHGTGEAASYLIEAVAGE